MWGVVGVQGGEGREILLLRGRLLDNGKDYLNWLILPFKLSFPLVSVSSHSPRPTSGKLIPAFSSKTDWESPGNALGVSSCEPRLRSSG